MRGVFLDTLTMKLEELDTSALEASLDHWDFFETTAAEETAARIAGADVVVSNKVVLDRPLIESAPNLKLICVCATGTNNIDLEAAEARSIPVRNVQGYAGASVPQHALALMLALATRWHQYDSNVKSGRWSQSPIFCLLEHPVVELAGKKLGIIGYGNLGQRFAQLGRSLGMEILVAESFTGRRQEGRVPLVQLLAESDVISLHCPLSAHTERLVDGDFLAAMKPGAFLINTARGGLIDEPALAAALKSGHLGGAALDVLSAEPPPPDHPLLAADIPNLIITPHSAWISRESRQRLLDGVVENIRRWRSGAANT
ncbi:D-2-hydroxyacid dehydrogenase [Microbulbifer thermotolerans]|uniref:D-2-hydroxyacid dehydrogenase n=1 Tax=Microbulbifer thermotolerans TaxID=252514 RepID=UPI00224B82C7|nr:D-2-hydroxyacid dehydrogenase [Microbulbifer thermotolerans]MCX2779491.1 D-2-hydroxyacid dehydrogenase [Microbulbifer thermotolerans]MCX2783324.1 D-2-hydroxyacid dehydrogenase [Microbulbifer thermotolerans]MCX2806064.1 D-2-hydroxyacid dehydrogenase [Microbulbifer thermotolerans]MCX2834846.1 D-2-hydroxyacid dehydrogenase [Microbulbifer thermotolerans]